MKNYPPNYAEEIVIGKIARSFGVKGYFKVIPLTDFPERFKNLKSVHLYSEAKQSFFKNDDGFGFEVEEAGISSDSIRLKLKGIDDKNQSDLLRGYLISIPIRERVERNANEFYYFELIDCEVFDEEGNHIGKVKQVEDFGGGDLLRISLEGTEKESYIPYRDEFILKVDKDKKRIDVRLIEGLIE